jgi:H+-transporting ATPase
LKISVSDFLTLFSARTGEKFFFQVPPAPILLAGGVIALTLSSLLAILWPQSKPDGIVTEGLESDMGTFAFVWIYCLIFWFIQDFLKVMVYKWMYATNFNNISRSGVVVLPDSAKKLIDDLEKALAMNDATGH